MIPHMGIDTLQNARRKSPDRLKHAIMPSSINLSVCYNSYLTQMSKSQNIINNFKPRLT